MADTSLAWGQGDLGLDISFPFFGVTLGKPDP